MHKSWLGSALMRSSKVWVKGVQCGGMTALLTTTGAWRATRPMPAGTQSNPGDLRSEPDLILNPLISIYSPALQSTQAIASLLEGRVSK